jgi:hypothetical protein
MPYHSEPQQFVAWLRAVAPYIHAFRGKTLVIGFAGELVTRGRLNALVQDLSLLHAMGMRLIVVYGSHPQIEEQMSLRASKVIRIAGLITTVLSLDADCADRASRALACAQRAPSPSTRRRARDRRRPLRAGGARGERRCARPG